MIVQKSYIDNNGRLVIPIKVRQKLKLKIGDKVTIKYNDSELIVSTFYSNIEKLEVCWIGIKILIYIKN
ncbi:MAG: AbrB/MazE/SpoVT family DNA-binding domain-containing protein [Rickettsia endosymbiont of Eriopis connexa]|nr:AbrB/MazE/SpoVT family DNA-binding domain-containing protein [Rickettsia endosymbiont of Eriopis connexa]